jgi:hypothetical protein
MFDLTSAFVQCDVLPEILVMLVSIQTQSLIDPFYTSSVLYAFPSFIQVEVGNAHLLGYFGPSPTPYIKSRLCV